MQLAKEIFSSKSLLMMAVLLSLAMSCKKEIPSTHTVYLSQEVMDYFVNYNPGMCWVYKDSLGRSGLDTVELSSVQKAYFDDGEGAQYQGYMMNYTSNGTINFRIWALANSDSSSGATLYPSISGEGDLGANYTGNKWSTGVYYDSLHIASGKIYHNVLKLEEGCQYFSNVRIAKDSGIIAFNGLGNQNQGGAFYLVSKFKK